MKQLVSVLLSALLIAAVFTGCSSGKGEKYSDSVLIIGYTENAAPFLEVSEDGKATVKLYAGQTATVADIPLGTKITAAVRALITKP